MPTPSPSSAPTPPASTARVPTKGAGPPLRPRRQVILDSEKLRARRAGNYISLDILGLGRHRLSPAAIRRAFAGQPVTVSIAAHLAQALGVPLGELVVREAEDDT